VQQTAEVIDGVLREAPLRKDSKQYPVQVKAIRTLFDGGGRNYDFEVLGTPAVPLGNYYMEVEIDGEAHGTDVRVLNDLAFSKDIRWSDSSLPPYFSLR
jgi:hypothetical protein